MRGWFSRAAIDCIARCAVMPTDESNFSGNSILKNYTNANPSHGLDGQLFSKVLQYNLLSSDFEIAFQFYSFANLLELAVRTGYVDLSDWDQREALSKGLTAFVAREAESKKPSDLTLIEALSTRLKEKEYRVENLDTFQFNAFASFINLETRIRNDSYAVDFIYKTKLLEMRNDLAFLVTPEQFSNTLAREWRNEVDTGTIRGGLATMQYFMWFADILQRLEKTDGLDEAFVREARWAQQAHSVRKRISIWAELMTEWAPGGYDHEGEFAWKQVSDACLVIIEKVNDLWPEKVVILDSSEEVSTSSADLEYEGRLGGALRLAREEAERSAYEFGVKLKDNCDDKEISRSAYVFLQDCLHLAKLGDTHNAAALINPNAGYLCNINNGDFRGDVIELLKQARAEKTISSRIHIEKARGNSENINQLSEPRYLSADFDE